MSESYQIRIGGGVDASLLNSVKDLREGVLKVQEGLVKTAEFFGVALGVREIVNFGKEALESAAKLGRLSQEVGIGVTELSKLKYAADLSEVGEHFRQGLLKMSETIAKASDKGSEAARYFQILGVSLADTTGKAKTTGQVILDIADKFHGWTDGANKADIAMRGFGTRNASFISFLNQGSDVIKEQGDQLEKLGGALTEDDVRKVEEFHRAMVELKTVLTAIAMSAGREILPAIGGMISQLVEAATGTNNWKDALHSLEGVCKTVGGAIRLITADLARQVDTLVTFIRVAQSLANSKWARAAFLGPAGFGLPGGTADIFDTLNSVTGKLRSLNERNSQRTAEGVKGLLSSLGLVPEGAAKTERHEGSKTEAPSIAGDKAATRDYFEQMREALKMIQDEVALKKEKLKVNYDLTDWEKRDLEVQLLDQETNWLSKQIDLLKQKRAITADDATREKIDKEIFNLTDQQGKLKSQRSGVTDSADPRSVSQQMRLGMTQLRQQFGTVATNIAEGFRSIIGGAVNSISSGITGLITRTKTWGQALREVGTSILTSIVSAIVTLGVRWVATQVLMAVAGKSIQASMTAATAPLAAASAAMWATPATLATIASYGAAATAAPGFILGAESAVAASSIPAFASGGWTPGGPTLAMVGEQGSEYVLNAPAASQYAPLLDAMNRRELRISDARSSGRSQSRTPVNVAYVNDRQDERQFQARDGWKITADALRKRGNRTV